MRAARTAQPHLGRWPRPGAEAALALLLTCVPALWLWIVTAEWPLTPDGDFHLYRTRALTEAFSQGVFYPRWFPDFAFGYGHPILHYYAPGSYVPPALLHLSGMGVLPATRLTLALAFGLSGAACYGALRAIAARPAALTGALLYLAFPYRLYDLLVRGALPEFAAFVWLPIILGAALWLLRWPQGWRPMTLIGALGWAGLALTHNLTTLMAALVFVLALPVLVWARRAWLEALRLSAAPALGALLSAFYTVPAVWEAEWVGIGSAAGAAGYANHFAGWQDLAQWGLRYTYPSAAEATVPLPGYAALLVGAGIAGTALSRNNRLPLAIALAGIALTVWLTTAASGFVWDAAAPILGKLQFPWRWQAILAIQIALLATLLLAWTPPRLGWVLALAVSYGVWLYALPPRPEVTAMPTISRAALWAFDATTGQIGATWTGEFLPRWVEAPRWNIGRAPETPPAEIEPVTVTAQAYYRGYLATAYLITAPETVTLTLDRFYFPAWRVTLNGTEAETMPSGELGLLTVRAPAGISRLIVDWAATPGVWAGRLLSGLGWLIVLALLWGWRLPVGDAKLPGRLMIGAWCVVGALALLGMSGWTHRLQPIHSLATGYRAVQLGGVHMRPVRQADGVAEVTLYWTVRAALPPLTVFVHVLDNNGRLVAQWDEPLGGSYRPVQRLTPGMLFRQTVTVPLALDPGEYRVSVGLYPAGMPQAPLTPLGTRQNRIAVGTLLVRP